MTFDTRDLRYKAVEGPAIIDIMDDFTRVMAGETATGIQTGTRYRLGEDGNFSEVGSVKMARVVIE